MKTNERRPCVYQFALDGKHVLGFDTGLDSRSFARARLAQLLSEPAYIVSPDGEYRQWKAQGIAEVSDVGDAPTMHFWGEPFNGDRLDDILADTNGIDGVDVGEEAQNKALSAVLTWLKAHLALGSIEAPLWPFAAFIAKSTQQDQSNASEGASDAIGGVSNEAAPPIAAPGTVFFPQLDIISRCIQTTEKAAWLSSQRYVHPGLSGIKAISFTMAAMLYQIFTGGAPFNGTDEMGLHEDMKDGNFLPIAFAAPGLDPVIAAFIQEALTMQNETPESVGPALKLLERFQNAELKVSSFFRELSSEEKTTLTSEENMYEKKRTRTLKTKRFILNNKAALIAGGVAAVVFFFFMGSIISGQLKKPTTKGMDSAAVVECYYAAFNMMDHQTMEACLYRNAGKADTGMVANFFVVTRMRQFYEYSQFQFVPAQVWLDEGQQPQKLPVFGITDLQIAQVNENSSLDNADYQASFILWVPLSPTDPENENVFEEKEEYPGQQTRGVNCADELKLEKIKGRWRIVEIIRDGKKR